MNLFKNLSLFLFATLTLTVFSCKDDEPSIEGNWRVISFSAINCTNSEDNATISGNATNGLCIEASGFEGCAIIDFIFSADGTAFSSTTTSSILGSETETSNGTWELAGNSMLTVCLNGDCTTSSYTVTQDEWTSIGIDSETGCDVTTVSVRR